MPVPRRTKPSVSTSGRPPATTPDERENQLIAAAVDLAEKQIREGTASAQVLTHYLKLGSSRERLEQKRLQSENSLLDAKKDHMESQQRVEDLIQNALKAMQAYSGNAPADQGGFDDFED